MIISSRRFAKAVGNGSEFREVVFSKAGRIPRRGDQAGEPMMEVISHRIVGLRDFVFTGTGLLSEATFKQPGVDIDRSSTLPCECQPDRKRNLLANAQIYSKGAGEVLQEEPEQGRLAAHKLFLQRMQPG